MMIPQGRNNCVCEESMTFEAYRQIFRLQHFRSFWIGFSISVLGDALTHVAFTWYVFEQTRSAAALGWLMLCFTGPIVVGGLIAGWLLDRFDRRTVILVDNLIRGLAVATIPLAHALGVLQLWQIYAVAAIYGLLMMISLGGGPALIPSLVPTEQLATANALEMISFTLGGVLGPILAGVLISLIGAPYAVALDALSYGIFALLLATLPRENRTANQTRGNLQQALKLLISEPVLLSTTLMFLCFNIGSGIMSIWLPILVDQMQGDAALYGTLLGTLAAGEVVSSLLAGGLVLRLALGARIGIAQTLAGLSLVLALFSSQPLIIGAALALYGFCSAPLTIWAQTLRMQIIPEMLRGRTFTLLRMLMQSGRPLGGGLGGALLPILGIPAAILISAALSGLPGVAGLAVRRLRRADGQATEQIH
jgi:MFS family permease